MKISQEAAIGFRYRSQAFGIMTIGPSDPSRAGNSTHGCRKKQGEKGSNVVLTEQRAEPIHEAPSCCRIGICIWKGEGRQVGGTSCCTDFLETNLVRQERSSRWDPLVLSPCTCTVLTSGSLGSSSPLHAWSEAGQSAVHSDLGVWAGSASGTQPVAYFSLKGTVLKCSKSPVKQNDAQQLGVSSGFTSAAQNPNSKQTQPTEFTGML